MQASDFRSKSMLKNSDLYEKEGKNQHAFCTDIDNTGDVRVLCNIKSNSYWMNTMLHEFGHAVYDKNIDTDLPFHPPRTGPYLHDRGHRHAFRKALVESAVDEGNDWYNGRGKNEDR